MPAPKGNKYWEFRDFFGTKKGYTPKEWHDKFIEYFEWADKRSWNKSELIKSGEMVGEIIPVPSPIPFSVKGFCLFAGVSMQTFYNYESLKGYEDYFEITQWGRTIIETQQLEGAIVGQFQHNIIARIQNIAERTDITTNGNEIKQVNVTDLISGFMGKKDDNV